LVGVHGGPGVPHDYLLPLTALSGERRVILYDQLDVGKSDKPNDPKNWNIGRFVSEIDALRRALGLEEIHLFGNSWGGTIAAEYAIGHPQGLRSLTLSGPLLSTARWVADNDDYIRALSQEAQDAITSSGGRGAEHDPKVAAAVAEYNRRHLCRADPWPDFLETAFRGLNTTVYNTMWGPTEFICTGTLQRYDCTGRLSHIQAPTLIMCGQYDESAPPTCHAFSKMIPGAQLAVIPNASHLPFIERPDPFLVILRTFLKESE
jgi:proline iminopeptidase